MCIAMNLKCEVVGHSEKHDCLQNTLCYNSKFLELPHTSSHRRLPLPLPPPPGFDFPPPRPAAAGRLVLLPPGPRLCVLSPPYFRGGAAPFGSLPPPLPLRL